LLEKHKKVKQNKVKKTTCTNMRLEGRDESDKEKDNKVKTSI
jgi:hypothetical protein